MSRRLPTSLRTWFGALLVCALFVCLSGMARPLTAMPAPMERAPVVMAGGHLMAPEVSGAAPHPAHCPMAEQRCEAMKATLGQDTPTGPVPALTPRATGCPFPAESARPHAPPRTAAPPDLHRLCVSRT